MRPQPRLKHQHIPQMVVPRLPALHLAPAILHDIDNYVVAPQLGSHSGGIGAMELALRALGESRDAAEELS